MGAWCSCCKGGGVLEDDNVEMTKRKRNAGQPAQQRPKRASKAETAEDRAKAAEAQRNAGLAAQRRQEEFDKSAQGKLAKKIQQQLKQPPKSSGESVLKWQMG